MSGLLEALYHGRVQPAARRVPDCADQLRLSGKISAEQKYLAGLLPPEEAARLEAFVSLHMEAEQLSVCDSFVYGFRLGARLMNEILAEPLV